MIKIYKIIALMVCIFSVVPCDAAGKKLFIASEKTTETHIALGITTLALAVGLATGKITSDQITEFLVKLIDPWEITKAAVTSFTVCRLAKKIENDLYNPSLKSNEIKELKNSKRIVQQESIVLGLKLIDAYTECMEQKVDNKECAELKNSLHIVFSAINEGINV